MVTLLKKKIYIYIYMCVCVWLSPFALHLKLSKLWKWKSLSHVRLFATTQTVQSMGFSRAEYCSGFPFSSPADLPNPGIQPRSPTLQADTLPAEPQGKTENTGMGSPSLLQWISPTQELNWGLLHCRRIFNQLSYQGQAHMHSRLLAPGHVSL